MKMGRERPRSLTRHLRPGARKRGRSRPTVCPPCPAKRVPIGVRIAFRFCPRSSGRSGHELPDNPCVEYASI
jgi:hypothetical protein